MTPTTRLPLLLEQNPFHLLGATLRDNARRIIALADEKVLELDDEICRKARSDLTAPNTRLAAEVGWLPGISPGKADELILALQERPIRTQDTEGLPAIVRVNLEAAAFQWSGNHSDAAHLPAIPMAGRIRRFSELWEAIDPEQVRGDLNEDRAVSGFPEIADAHALEAELAAARRRHRDIVIEVLNRMAPAALVEAVTTAVQTAPDGEGVVTNAFLDDLVDSYQEEVRGFLDEEAAKIESLVRAGKQAASNDGAAVSGVIADIEKVASAWVKVAAPIQLSLKARGIQHDLSHRVGFTVRGLGLTLFNEHGMLEEAERITGILRRLFPYVPDVAARVAEDVEAVEGIRKNQQKAAADQEEWEERIAYQTEVGLWFKKKLSISKDGIQINGEHYPLASITRVRWGGIRRSSGNNFTIAVGDNKREAIIQLGDGTKFQAFVECLWPAVCVRLMTSALVALKEGREVAFGDVIVTDLGVKLPKHKMFGSNERVFCDWWQIETWSRDGSFYIRAKDDKKTYVGLAYLYVPNAHILEHLIGAKFKTQDKKISALLG